MTGRITPCLWFAGGQAREAASLYAATFPDSAVSSPVPDPLASPASEMAVEFTVLGMPFLGLNGGPEGGFGPGVSFQVHTDSQEETDRYWDAIVADGGSESRCGWCQDRFGVSWQITPRVLMRAIADPDRAAAGRAMKAMMGMRRIDIAAIERAFAGTDTEGA
jgi:predicted 3-demethylubiquinone-9 3-methyltransferase (glyoxalase superfamily)